MPRRSDKPGPRSSHRSPQNTRSRRALAIGILLVLVTVGVIVGLGPAADAKPEAPSVLCDAFPDSATCDGWLPRCETCHYSTQPVSWNPFGIQMATLMNDKEGEFSQRLAASLGELTTEQDSDGDGFSDVQEIAVYTNPGLADEHLDPPADPVGTEPNPRYDVGNYDTAFAYKRVNIVYCGVGPSWEDMQAFDAAEDKRGIIHETLDECLASNFWRRSALPRLADKRIRPILAVKGLSDYDWDYNLWEYCLTDGRDARLLLTADFHVDRNEQTGELEVVTGVIPNSGMNGNNGQRLAPEYRAGMLTTQWFLLINTMFSAMPRTTAAQAYRAYLGMDIARNEGIWPSPETLVDVDYKGITAKECAVCHTTVDTLSYPFVNYHGLTGPVGDYDSNRAANLIPEPVTEQGYLFGQQVNSLVEWANVAANSPAFRRNLAHIFWTHALEAEPAPHQQNEFRMLADGLEGSGWSADQLLHDLVDTRAFGAP